MARQPSAQQSGYGLTIREELDEPEAPTECGVEQGDRTVGRVHRADDAQVVRHGEPLGRVLQVDRLVAVFEQEVQLAEDLGHVAAVHLVDDQDVEVGPIGVGQ